MAVKVLVGVKKAEGKAEGESRRDGSHGTS
jgi:hypothetical protein